MIYAEEKRLALIPMTFLKFISPLLLTLSFVVPAFSAITLSNGNLTPASQGAQYSATFVAIGGTAPYTYSIWSGVLPSGLSVSANVLSGIPQNAGTFNFVVRVVDSTNLFNDIPLTLQVNSSSGLQILTSSLPQGQAGASYITSLGAAGGTGSYLWDLESNSFLPNGLTIASNGTILGVPNVVGDFSFVVRVRDSGGNIALANFTIRINSNLLAIGTTSLPNGNLGGFYSQALTITGGTQPYFISVFSGALPPGLSLSNSGVISGTPAALGASNFTIRVSDSSVGGGSALRPLAITIVPAQFAINPVPLPVGQVASAYSATISAAGGTAPYNYSILTGSLPTGINFTNGTFSGTPSVSGSFPLVLRAQDSTSAVVTANFNLVINSITLILSNAPLPNAVINQNYSFTFTASGGFNPYNFSLVGGTLPSGFSLSSSGVLSGFSSVAGSFPISVRVTDGQNSTNQASFTLTISSNNLSLNTNSLPTAFSNLSYTANLSATGGSTPYQFSIFSGALPQGLTLLSNGTISGTPTVEGTFLITFRVQDAAQASAQSTVSLVVSSAGVKITTLSLASGRLGQPYSGNISASGGNPPYNFILSAGLLPNGLTMSLAGFITGVPAIAGNSSFTVRVIDNSGTAAESNFSLSINTSALSLSNFNLPTAQLSQAYSVNLSGSGGAAPYSFLIVSGGLPPGISLAANGAFTGTASAVGIYNFAVEARDAVAATAIFNLSILVNTNAVTITTTNLNGGVLGQFYSSQLAASGGSGIYTYLLQSGSLPSGLNLSGTGQVSGTPNSSGSSSFTVRVTDSLGTTSTANLSILISASGNLVISNTSLPSGQLNQPYNAVLSFSGGVAPYTPSIVNGFLPPGLTLNQFGGISGTPTTGGNYTFLLRVTDGTGAIAQRSLSINIGISNFFVSTTSLPNGQVGQSYSSQISASGGQFPYNWSVVAGGLPSGLTLSSQGLLAGIPSGIGLFQFTVQATDATGIAAQKQFDLTIGSFFLSFLTTNIPQGSINQQFSFQLLASGGSVPYAFSIVSGSLPQGLTLSVSGLIQGIPVTTSLSVITFRVTDLVGATAQVVLNVAVGQTVLQFTTTSIPSTSIGQNYSVPLLVVGGATPYSFSISSGTLPAGFALSSSGTINGVASATGTFPFTVRVQDSANSIVLQNFTLTVAASTLQFTTTTLPAGRLNQVYSQTLQTTGGTLPVRFEILSTLTSGFLPPGVSLSLGGILSGTPQSTGTFTFSVRATDAVNLVAQTTFTLVITAAGPSITTSQLPGGTAGQTYSQNISAAGGTPPYAFSVASGQLPPSLSLSSTGILSGTANSPGIYSFTVRVTDSLQQSADVAFSIDISAGAISLSINALAPPPGLLYFPYSFLLSASGGRTPYAWSIPTGSIPNGVRLDPNGLMSGLLLSPGVYRFTARVSDANGATSDVSLAVTVANSVRLGTSRVGNAYSAQLPVPTFGRSPFSFTLNGNALGGLPVGLSLAADGLITGTATTAGDYTFGVLVRDGNGFSSNAVYNISVLTGLGLSILTPSLPGGATGSPYSQTLEASGGRPPYQWVVSSGAVPNGLILNPATGQITGSPTLQGTGFFVARVTDASGSSATSYFGISVGAAGSPVINAITSAASYGANGVAPGELLVIFGGTLGPQSLTSFSLVNNAVPSLLAGTRVLFDGVAAPIIYTQAGQASVIAPYSLQGSPSTRIVVDYLGFQSTPFLLPVVSSKPGLFTVDGSGQGPAALLNQNGSLNTSSNRAAKESVIVLYLTGAGAMSPAGLEGRVAAGISSLNQQTLVTINGAPAAVQYAGNAPGLVEGVVQVNVKLPLNTVAGQNLIVVQIGSTTTTANTTVWVE